MSNFEHLLEEALQPTAEPGGELNAVVLKSAYEGQRAKRNIFGGIPKVAVAALAIMLACPMGVYAAKAILKQVHVTEHMVSVGSEEFIDDAAVAESLKDEEVKVEKLSSEEGNASVKWLRKETELAGGVTTNTYYYYDDFASAMADSGLENWLTGNFEMSTEAIYVHSDDGEVMEDAVNAAFLYGEGGFEFHTSKLSGNVAETVANSLFIGETSNKRTYVSKAGYEFTLVDNVNEIEGEKFTTTYVLVSYNQNFGYLGFYSLTEDEIKQVLDAVLIGGEEEIRKIEGNR